MPLIRGIDLEIIPQKFVYGGAALAHHEGLPVLVRGALPGERVQAEVIRQAKGMVHARTLQVITPSPERVDAPCPYFGTCGGCHYQQLDARRQVEVKSEILRETLRRVGRIDWGGEIATHAADPWRYRNHAQLKVGIDRAGATALGFFEADSHRLVPVNACPILSPSLNQILGELSRADWLRRLTGIHEIDLFVDDQDDEVMLTARGEQADREGLAKDWLNVIPGVKTVVFESMSSPARAPRSSRESSGSQQRSIFGKGCIEYRVGDHKYQVSPGSFFQASRFLLPDLVKAVTTGAPGDLAVDLYAGVGLFTIPLAGQFEQVIGVEANPPAAADMTRNIGAAALTNARAVRSSSADFLRRYAGTRPDLVVLDPPRAGADAGTLRLLAQIGPPRICYVSCQPPTFTRDLAFLLRHGYRLDSIDLFDLFPQTFHIESVARLVRP